MAARLDPSFALAIGTNADEIEKLNLENNPDEEPMTLASAHEENNRGKFFPTKFCILS